MKDSRDKSSDPLVVDTGVGSAARVYEVDLDDAFELMDLLDPFSGCFAGGAVFRGQADSGWHLIPSVFRDNIPFLVTGHKESPPVRSYGLQVKLEIELIWLFTARANEAGLVIPGDSDRVRSELDAIRQDPFWAVEEKNLRSWPPPHIVPTIALAQHHGIPTRLLDWTFNPLVAAYFGAEGAARSGPHGKFSIWVCYTRENDRTSVQGAPSVELARPSNAFNPNLRAQRGCLMLWRKGGRYDNAFGERSLEMILSQEADRAGITGPPIFRKINVPKSEAGALLELLSLRQVDGSTLFPNFDGVARVVHERIYWRGYKGTGAKEFDGRLCSRTAGLKDRFYKGMKVYGDRNYDVNTDRLDAAIKSIQSQLDAGDYLKSLDVEIDRWSSILREVIASKDPRRAEIEKVLKALVSLK